MHRLVSALVRTDGPRGAHIVRLGDEGVVLALAVHLANGVDGGQVHRVKAHLLDAGELLRGGGKGAVDGLPVLVQAAGGAGENLIPRGDEGLAALHKDPELGGPGEEVAQRRGLLGFLHGLVNLVRQRRIGVEECDNIGEADFGAQACADLDIVGHLLL